MEALGHEIIWQAENDKACCTVLERHWPNTPNLGDITKVDWSQTEPVEMIFGGPPCQPISTAGKREGSQDERWLWPYVLDAVRILRPRYAFFENPAAFLGAIEYPRGSGRWWPPPIETLVGALAEMGFDAEWGVFRASDVGAPHRRERVFILAGNSDRGGLSIDTQPDGETEEPLQAPRRRDTVGSTSAHSEGERLGGGGRHGRGGLDLRTAVADLDGAGLEGTPRDGILTVVPSEGTQFAWGHFEAAIRRWEAVTGPHPAPLLETGGINPEFAEWFMGHPIGWTEGPAKTRRIAMLGNAVLPPVAALAYSVLSVRLES